jgi:hypothetical protein
MIHGFARNDQIHANDGHTRRDTVNRTVAATARYAPAPSKGP